MDAFKCPNCGGGIEYDIEKESMKCSYCNSLIDRKLYQNYLDKHDLYVTDELTCPQCGATMLSYDDTLATFCNYCGSSVMFNRRIVEDTKPVGIIPFAITKEQAAKSYRAYMEQFGFAPNWVHEEGEQKLLGIYMPYYVYDVTAKGHTTEKAETRLELADETKVSEYDVSFDMKAYYNGVRFDAAETFPDFLSESIDDFADEKAVAFQSSYLAGYYADGGNVSEEIYNDLVEDLVRDDIKTSEVQVKARYDVTPENMDPDVKVRAQKLLLPVWLNTHRIGDRVCYAAINGQTGKVAGEVPIDKWKYLKYAIVIAAFLSIPMNLFLTLKPSIFLIISIAIILIFGVQLNSVRKDVYIHEHYGDDLGKLGIPNLTKYEFRKPKGWSFRGWWRTILGIAIAVVVLISRTPQDDIYYGVAIFNILLVLWMAFDLIRQQNKLASRDIPVFTMERGGDRNV